MNEATVLRTPAQTDASRTNGAKSAGPTTALGKTTSSSNGIVHGLAAHGALMPAETVEMYETNLSAWLATIPTRTPGERQAVARLADVSFRYDRLARMEVRLANANLERKVAESASAKARKVAQDALDGVRGLAVMCESVDGPRHVSAVASISPAIRRTAQMVDEADVPVGVSAVLDRAVAGLEHEDFVVEVPATAFHALAAVARATETALVDRIAELGKELDTERERLADEALLGDDEQTKVIDRHRSRLDRAMKSQIEVLKLLREVAAPEEILMGSGSSVPFHVELKVLGRSGG
jgi:hypothetical protein